MKKYLLLFATMLYATLGIAQNASILNRVDSKEELEKRSHNIKERLLNQRTDHIEQYRSSDILSVPILTEDFSKFTEGSVEDPDATRLDDPNTYEIDDAYFNNTSGWGGLEVYQAGGCVFLDFSVKENLTGALITPYINTSGNITVKCKVRSVSKDGELFCYNLIDENNYELDMDYTYIPGQEWVEVEFASSAGESNSYIMLFGMYDAIFIDDIEITNHYIPAPTLLPETNITSTGFTANWQIINGVDDYYFTLSAKHIAQIEETYFFADHDFSEIVSNGTPSHPETSLSTTYEFGSWYAFSPVFISNAIGISGIYSDLGYYGFLASPQYDLSSNGGKFNISFSLMGSIGDSIEVNVFNNKDICSDSREITLESNEWTEYTFTINNGDEASMIEIVYYGSEYLFLDDLKVYQDLATGDRVNTPILQKLCGTNSLDITIQECHKFDELSYQIYGIKYIYAYDYEYGGYYASYQMNGDSTEPRLVTLGTDDTENVKDMEVESPAFARFSKGQLNIYNPNNEMVSVYNINGVCVYRETINGTVNLNLAKGSYIVTIGNKVIKAVN